MFTNFSSNLPTEVYFWESCPCPCPSFVEMMKVLDDYFIPKANVPFERHLLRRISQATDVTVDQLVCKLRQHALCCDFGEFEDDYIHDQLIDKCYSNHLRCKFLEQEGTVNCLLKVAREQEAASCQLRDRSELWSREPCWWEKC